MTGSDRFDRLSADESYEISRPYLRLCPFLVSFYDMRTGMTDATLQRMGIPDRAGAGSPDEAIVYHRAETLVAEVTLSIEEETEARVWRVKRVAKDLESFANASTILRELAKSVESISGARAARHLRSIAALSSAMETLSPMLDRAVVRDHDTFVDVLGDRHEVVVATVREFADWVRRYRDELEEKVRAFGALFADDLRADAARQREIAAEWSVVDGDGVT
jgi:hypothetical protein